jgi:hypothetical protein
LDAATDDPARLCFEQEAHRHGLCSVTTTGSTHNGRWGAEAQNRDCCHQAESQVIAETQAREAAQFLSTGLRWPARGSSPPLVMRQGASLRSGDPLAQPQP